MSYLLRSLLCLSLLLACGCKKKQSTPDPVQKKRFETLRRALQKKLGEQYHASIPEASAEQIRRGAELFSQLCAACHGSRGNGVSNSSALSELGAPSNFTDPKAASFFSDRARLEIIKTGIPGTAMMGWGSILREKDMISIYLYVKSLINH